MTEKNAKIAGLEEELMNKTDFVHELELKLKEAEGDRQFLSNQVEKLNIELNELNSSMQNRKTYSLDEIKNLMEEHQQEKEEWETIRESWLTRPVL